MKFSENLKTARKNKNMTQKNIYEALKVSANCYASYEQGRTEPSIETIIKLCKILNVSSDYLFGLEDEDGTKIESRKPEARNEALINNSFNHNSGNFNIDIKK